MSILRRRIGRVLKEPVLVKLTDNPGTNQSYTLLSGYRYVDMLIVGGGGGGGHNSGGGGGSGTIVYVKNLRLSLLHNRQAIINISSSALGRKDGNSTTVTIDGKAVIASGGYAGGDNGGQGGSGGALNTTSNLASLSDYVEDLGQIAIANNGGGGAGAWDNDAYYGVSGASGGSFISSGYGIYSQANGDGPGGFYGGSGSNIGGNYGGSGGIGYRINTVVIPIQSVFQGGGTSGAGTSSSTAMSGSGGGAAGYNSGGRGGGSNGNYGGGGGGGLGQGGTGGRGGQGIICLYYHN